MATQKPGQPDLSDLNGCACYQVRRLSRRITQVYDRHLMENGLTVTQFGVLSAVREMGPVPVTALGEALGTDRTTITRLLQPLERDGLIATAEAADKRTRAVEITARGHDVFEAGIPHWKAAYKELKARLAPLGVDALIDTLSEANALFAEDDRSG